MLQPSLYKFLVLFVALAATFPYFLLSGIEKAQQLNIETSFISLTQGLLATFIFKLRKEIKSYSLSLFWLFIAFALIVACLSSVIQLVDQDNVSAFGKDFLSLITYLLVFLAIETNPHLSKIPLNKYINGRIPAIFFVVTCFCYFVLLPFQFSTEQYASSLPSTYFHTAICGLVLIRLISHLISCQDKDWLKFYLLLVLGALALFVYNLNTFMSFYDQRPLPEYIVSVLSFVPLLFALFAFKLSFKLVNNATSTSKEQQVETYLFTLTLGLVTLHILGQEYNLPYAISGLYQPTALILWCVASLLFVFSVSKQKVQNQRQLKKENQQLSENTAILNQQNVQLHKAILNSEEKAIVASSNNAIITTSSEGTILSVNPAAVHLFQKLEHEFVGANISELFCTEQKMHHFFKFDSNLYSLQRKEKGISVESIAQRRDGESFPVQVSLQWTERNEQSLVVVTFINLTERKLAEKQALDLKDKFIANISHEFRTPLTIINGILDRYLTTTNDDTQVQELNTAKRNGLRLVRMVEQLLELSRVSDNPKLTMNTYRLSSLMDMPLDSFRKLAEQHNLKFKAKIPESFWIDCDPQAFEKIIFNLLANAVKYTPSGGEVEVNAFQEGDTVYLAVIDTGIGINNASKNKIFERFQRADDEKNKAIFGVGIGLSLVNELIKAHHWRISLVSEYNKGSKFTIAMPVATPLTKESNVSGLMSADEVASLINDSAVQTNTEVKKAQSVVLVIEDNRDMQSHIKQIIEHEHHCLLSVSGEQGLTIAQEYIPDLIVCDIMLTGMDGFDVLKQLKQNELTSHIPVILLTARSDLDSRLKGLNLRADDYLSKPFNQKELLVRIDGLIKNRNLLQETYRLKFSQDGNSEASSEIEEQIETVNDKFIDKLNEILERLYIEPELDIKVLARELAVSERQLQRKLKVLTGTTPNHYIKDFRLEKAETLLKSGAPIGLIALDVGFSSQTYFGRCFKEKYHCTPKQFQAKYL